jgi:alpha-L-fucosidase 2
MNPLAAMNLSHPLRALRLPVRLLAGGLVWISSSVVAQPARELPACNVVWNSPSEDSRGSMPLGNGDLGLNVWVEQSGDLVFYLSKTDAWGDNVHGNKGLLKLGRVRVKLSPPLPVGDGFSQTLKLAEGAVEIRAGAANTLTTLRVWVDANRPVMHVEAETSAPGGLEVALESLRTAPEKDVQADTIPGGQTNRVVWYYRNQNRKIPALTDRTFGGAMRGEGLISSGGTGLRSAKPARRHVISLCALTAQTPTPEAWLALLDEAEARAEAVPLADAWRQHAGWWREFWNRSWLFVRGDDDARRVTEGYVLQRYVTACAGRGAYPIKFNGSIFNTDYLKREKIKGVETNYWMSADARSWGGQYWFQNTRPMYWPMLECGDFDLMQPFFKMFRDMLPANAKLVRDYYGHDGAYFAETAPFWGGFGIIGANEPGGYTKHYFTPILELSALMLDYFAYTGDREFARATLLPIAEAGVAFFEQHFPRDEQGRLLLDPDNAIEMYWKARNPAPDIAGLRWVLRRLMALPPDLTSSEQRAHWRKFAGAVPELPVGETNGVKVLLPAEVFDKSRNSENPELYPIYPFRLFGLSQPGLELARATFAARRVRTLGCWHQDGVQAALLGETDVARKNVVFALTRQDRQLRFPAFWDPGHDYAPDQDNGGNGMNTLQRMLMQCEGRSIRLLPAWPTNWNATFKLHAPGNTTVEGRVDGGKILDLQVTPPSRRTDVVLPAAAFSDRLL